MSVQIRLVGPRADVRATLDFLTQALTLSYISPPHPVRIGDPSQVWLYAEADPPGARRPTAAAELTARELQILRHISQGKTNPQIARELFLATDTVKTHSRKLFRKLGVHSRSAAINAAWRRGILGNPPVATPPADPAPHARLHAVTDGAQVVNLR